MAPHYPDAAPDSAGEYAGPERRRRRVYVTQHHEYHCKDGICIAVRDVESGSFLPSNSAIGRKASGSVLLRDGGIASFSPPERPSPGERMHFAYDSEDRGDILTSRLRSVERPPRDVVAMYEPD
jgi:hypothetical protein